MHSDASSDKSIRKPVLRMTKITFEKYFCYPTKRKVYDKQH